MPTSQQHLYNGVENSTDTCEEYLDKVNDGATEYNGVTAAAATLPPTIAKQGRDPERQETDPNSRRRHQVVEAILTRINVRHIVCGVVIVRGVVRRGGGATSVIVNTHA